VPKAQRFLRYGVEAPYVPAYLAAGAVIFVLLAVFFSPFLLIVAVFFAAQAAIFLYTTIAGKLRVWAGLLDGLGLRGDEAVLDLGCGRGAVLVAAAQRVPNGKCDGVDLWRTKDQSGNGEEVAMANASAAGVADRIELHTADMRKLPFADASFDVVTSALAVHNIPDPAGRAEAVTEAWRVLKPGGRLVLVDFRHTQDYQRTLLSLGAGTVTRRNLGVRYWYGGPWAAASAVLAAKE
jgi:arsenite methyltransferase